MYEKQISGPYYLVAVDAMSDLNISRELPGGDYIGRIPQRVTAYAVVNDSFLFAKSASVRRGDVYYVLNMTDDHDYAKIEDIVTGPLDSARFYSEWKSRYPVKFIQVKLK